MREYIRLFKFIRPHTGLFALSCLFMALSAAFDGVSLGMLMPMADIVLTQKKIVLPASLPPFLADMFIRLNALDPQVLLKYMAIGVVVIFTLKSFFGFLQTYLMNKIALLVVKDVRSKLFHQFQRLSLDYFSNMRGGELMSRITSDVVLIGHAISYGGTDLIYQSLQVAVFALLIVFLHPKLAVVSIIILPLISLPIVKVGGVIKKITRRAQEKMADINSLLYETIIGVRVVKAFNMEDAEIAKFDDANNDFYRLSMKSVKRVQFLSPATEMIGVIAAVCVLFLEGRQVINGTISFGVLAVSIAALLSMLRPFKKLSQVNAIVQQAIAANVRVHDVLELEPTVRQHRDARALAPFRESIVFEDVWFNYGPNPVLKGIRLEVKRGQVLAIVGPSGAGKTTLLDLIPRFYDPQKGRVLIDGIDVRTVTFYSLRQQIGIVTQETILFNDTIRANIAYGMAHTCQRDIEEAARQASVHDVIMRFPHGYDTRIGDRGTRLSGGERQRIAIARALLKNAPILILDEATSQLDTESERLVQEAINRLIKGRTVLVIAHRLSTIKNAHRIIVLDGGSIVEQGTHDELVAQAGLYRRLYENQQLQR